MICLGLVAGYFMCYGTVELEGTLSWRLPYIILAALALAFIPSLLLYLPPSPRWLRLHGRDAEADAAWATLGVKMEDRQRIEEDLEQGVFSTNDTGSTTSSPPTQALENEKQRHGSFFDIFERDVRSRTGLAVFLMGFLQLSGIDAV